MADIVKARLDATNKQIVLEVVNDSTGVVVTSWGQVVLKLGQIPAVGTPTSPEHRIDEEMDRWRSTCSPTPAA